MRVGIGAKIFGTAFLLVLLMTAAAVATAVMVGAVTEELARIDRAFVPISRAVATVEKHALEQEILFERAVGRLQRDPGADIASLRAALEKRGAEVDATLAAAGALIVDVLPDTRHQEHREPLVRLNVMLEEIEREHQQFEALSQRTLAAMQEGRQDLAAELLALVQREEEEFDRSAQRASLTAAQFADAAVADAVAAERRVLMMNLGLTALAALAGLVLSVLVVRGMVRPVRALLTATREVRNGNLAAHVDNPSGDEIGELSRSFNHMTGELRIKEEIKETFGRYVDPRIVENLLGDDGSGVSAGENAIYTVYFSDIEGFTAIAERLAPSAIVDLVNGYFSAMSAPIRDHDGIIDKYIGDSIMAFWGPPFTDAAAHAGLACRTALEQQARLAAFQDEVPALTGLRRDVPHIGMRIGIATGEVVAGSIGSEQARNYTVMGDTVNLGARLERLNKLYGTRILVADATRQAAGVDFAYREIDSVGVAGREQPVRIFELLAAPPAADSTAAGAHDAYARALAAYRDGDWAQAEAGFRSCLELTPGDRAPQVFLQRLGQLGGAPPPDGWDGVWRVQEK